jgi:hypothetical protein
MIRAEIKQLKTGPRELRKFGFTVGAVFMLLGVWFWWRGKSRFPYFLAPGILLIVLGTAAARVLGVFAGIRCFQYSSNSLFLPHRDSDRTGRAPGGEGLP